MNDEMAELTEEIRQAWEARAWDCPCGHRLAPIWYACPHCGTKRENAGRTWSCGRCGEMNTDREFCGQCSARRGTWHCDRCGRLNDRGTHECSNCGDPRPDDA